METADFKEDVTRAVELFNQGERGLREGSALAFRKAEAARLRRAGAPSQDPGGTPHWTPRRRLIWLLSAVWWKHKGAPPPRSNEGTFVELVNSTAADTDWPQQAGEDASGRTITKALKSFTEKHQSDWLAIPAHFDAPNFLKAQANYLYEIASQGGVVQQLQLAVYEGRADRDGMAELGIKAPQGRAPR